MKPGAAASLSRAVGFLAILVVGCEPAADPTSGPSLGRSTSKGTPEASRALIPPARVAEFQRWNIAAVKVLNDGALYLNNREVTVEQLHAALRDLAEKEGARVWYFREESQRDPPKTAMLAVEAIHLAGLGGTIRRSDEPDFADVTYGEPTPADPTQTSPSPSLSDPAALNAEIPPPPEPSPGS